MNPNMSRRPILLTALASTFRMTILALLVPTASAAATETRPARNTNSLGTLFYSPAQRAATAAGNAYRWKGSGRSRDA